MLCFFFFFQAEDGIRDYKVTGVQTCALPISPESLGVPVAERGEVGGVGAEDRRPEGGRLGADVRALAERAARPAAGAARGRGVRAGIAVARVVVAAPHDLELGAELARVLVLEQLLRGQQVGVTAPPR